MVNLGKKDTSSETEVFQQVIAELRAEVKSLTEQLEQERKAASDAKSLKTKQISTLTSKLANAVRQRERAEEDLANMKKEMEELKEHLRLQADEREAKESEDATDSHKKEDENSLHQCLEETDEVVNTQHNIRAKENNTAWSCLENNDTKTAVELIENEIVSLQLENKSTEDSLDENSPTEELSQSATNTEASVSLSWTLSDDSFKDKPEELFNLEVSQSSSLEMCNSNHIFIHSFESDEENQEEKEAITQEFMQIEEDLCVVQENMNQGLGEDVKSITEERQKILESANQSSANGRLCAENSEEYQKSSPPSSPVLSGYALNSTDEKVEKFLMCHEMGDEHGTAVFPGNEDKEEKVYPKGFLKGYESDDDTRETTKAQDKKALEDLITNEEATESVLNKNYKPLEDRYLSSKTIGEVYLAKKGVRQSSEEQNDLPSHSLSDEFWDLKQQLKNALKKIEELRLENKEMKREIRNLSSSTLEEEFLLKTTKFTDRLLKEMKKRDAKMYVPGVSHTEKCELERDYSKSKYTDLGQMRSTGGENRSVGRNTSLPLKIIGAKLKELTESVESMATDPELCQENFSDLYVSDVMGYKQRFSHLNDQFKLEESLIIPASCSEAISQSAPFKQENPREQLQGGGHTSVEKLGEKSFLASSKVQLQFAEEAWEDGRFQQTDRQTREQGDFDSPRVQRYVVRSSDHIAKMRDLTPEEKAFYSKLA